MPAIQQAKNKSKLRNIATFMKDNENKTGLNAKQSILLLPERHSAQKSTNKYLDLNFKFHRLKVVI